MHIYLFIYSKICRWDHVLKPHIGSYKREEFYRGVLLYDDKHRYVYTYNTNDIRR